MIIRSIGYFRIAKAASKMSVYRIKVGACLSNGKPVAVGWNKDKTHPLFSNPELSIRRTIHAEMDCISGLDFNHTKGRTIYVYREDANGSIANARPCDECMFRLREAGIKTVFYTTKEPPYYRSEKI